MYRYAVCLNIEMRKEREREKGRKRKGLLADRHIDNT
jgi:hypothetical protein